MKIYITRESNTSLMFKFFSRMWVHFEKPRKFLVKELYLGEPNEYIDYRSKHVDLMTFSEAINNESFNNQIVEEMFKYFGTSDLNEWPNCPQTADDFVMEIDLDIKIKDIKITTHDGATIIDDQAAREVLPF